LQVFQLQADFYFLARVYATRECAMVGLDWVICCLKAWHGEL
jgi:hypothetical protein